MGCCAYILCSLLYLVSIASLLAPPSNENHYMVHICVQSLVAHLACSAASLCVRPKSRDDDSHITDVVKISFFHAVANASTILAALDGSATTLVAFSQLSPIVELLLGRADPRLVTSVTVVFVMSLSAVVFVIYKNDDVSMYAIVLGLVSMVSVTFSHETSRLYLVRRHTHDDTNNNTFTAVSLASLQTFYGAVGNSTVFCFYLVALGPPNNIDWITTVFSSVVFGLCNAGVTLLTYRNVSPIDYVPTTPNAYGLVLPVVWVLSDFIIVGNKQRRRLSTTDTLVLVAFCSMTCTMGVLHAAERTLHAIAPIGSHSNQVQQNKWCKTTVSADEHLDICVS